MVIPLLANQDLTPMLFALDYHISPFSTGFNLTADLLTLSLILPVQKFAPMFFSTQSKIEYGYLYALLRRPLLYLLEKIALFVNYNYPDAFQTSFISISMASSSI